MTRLLFAFAALALAAPAAAQQEQRVAPTLPNVLTVFDQPEYNGRMYEVRSMRRNGVETPNGNWPVRSFSIHPGDRWEICELSRFRNCVVIDRSVPDTSMIGLASGRIGSTRQVTAEAE